MSPPFCTKGMVCKCFPRTRGDEPRGRQAHAVTPQVFPAHAGMSLESLSLSAGSDCFPRTRGDEPPTFKALAALTAFSPHTRG